MKCPDLENPLNGKVNVKKQTLDSHKCKEGFVLTGGDRVRKCLARGSWSGKAPLCMCEFMCNIMVRSVRLNASLHVARCL